MGSSCCSASNITESKLILIQGSKKGNPGITVTKPPVQKNFHLSNLNNTNSDSGTSLPELPCQQPSPPTGSPVALRLVDQRDIEKIPESWQIELPEALPYQELFLQSEEEQACVSGVFHNDNQSCFFNVVLQLLTSSPGLREYFLSNLQVDEAGFTGLSESISYLFGDFVQIYHSYDDFVINPKKFLEGIKELPQVDNILKQPFKNRAINFLSFMLNTLDFELNRAKGQNLKKISKVLKTDEEDDSSDKLERAMSHQSQSQKSLQSQGTIKSKFSETTASIGTDTPQQRFSDRNNSRKKSSSVTNKTSSMVKTSGKGLQDPVFSDSPLKMDCFKRVKTLKKGVDASNSKVQTELEKKSFESWKTCLGDNSSIVRDSFLGQILITLECQHCQAQYARFEPFFILELPIPYSSEPLKLSLQTVLQRWSQKKLIQTNKFHCEKCCSEQSVVRKFQIWKLPPVLLISLKVQETSEENHSNEKNECIVEINLDDEDFSRHIGSPFTTPAIYSLYFVIVDLG